MSAQKYFRTDRSDELIRHAYQSAWLCRVKSVKVCARRLGWLWLGDQKASVVLGLARRKEKPWSSRELEILERNAHFHPIPFSGNSLALATSERKLRSF